MNRVDVIIHILPNNVSLTRLLGFSPEEDGKTFSSVNDVKINKAKYGYSILYSADDFMRLDKAKFTAAMIKIFTKNLPGTALNVSVEYNYEELIDEHFDEAVGNAVINFGALLTRIDETKRVPGFTYEASQNLMDIIYDEYDTPLDDDDDEDGDDDDEFSLEDLMNGKHPRYKKNDDEEEDEDQFSYEDPFRRFLHDDDDEKDNDKGYYYGKSRVVADAHNGKRDFHRHGVIIASKSDIAKDRKILKKFLKDFIPGNSSWKKDFRDDVLKRWMSMYTISKKDLKYMQSGLKKSNYEAKRNNNITNAINLTTKLFTTPVDRWYDPSR